MKREYLKELGLADDVIDKIMAENGKDIESEKTKIIAKETELTTANKTIKDLQDAVKKFDGVDVEKLKKDAADWETKYNADTAQIKLDSALEMALVSNKAKNTKAVKALLDASIIKMDGEKLLGLDDQLKKLKTDSAYLFDEITDPTKVKIDSGKQHQDPPGATGPTSLLGALQEKYK